jgi:hypothetical protein
MSKAKEENKINEFGKHLQLYISNDLMLFAKEKIIYLRTFDFKNYCWRKSVKGI